MVLFSIAPGIYFAERSYDDLQRRWQETGVSVELDHCEEKKIH